MTMIVAALLLLLQPPDYHRAQWPHWQGGCVDVRERVLIDESRRPVRLSADGCRVLAGEWLDPYSGELVTTPAALDIDHVVSLRAAHRAGGWRWSRDRKRAYANDLVDPDHLLAVSASLNRAKGDRGPSQWMPPRRAFHCSYARMYQRIATLWRLTLPPADRAVITRTLRACPS